LAWPAICAASFCVALFVGFNCAVFAAVPVVLVVLAVLVVLLELVVLKSAAGLPVDAAIPSR